MELAKEAALASKSEYLDLQLSQLAQGTDSQKQATTLNGNGYTAYTKDLKQKYGKGLGAVVDRVTLYQTGKMYKSADLDVKGEVINVTFNTEYSSDLMKRTGDVIIGLNDDNRADYINGPFFQAFKNLFENKTKLQLT